MASRDVRSCDEATSAHSTPPRSTDRATGSPVVTTHRTQRTCGDHARLVELVETTRPGPEVDDESFRDFFSTQGETTLFPGRNCRWCLVDFPHGSTRRPPRPRRNRTLASLVADRRTADRAEADLLAKVAHWCDLHPVLDPDAPDAEPVAVWPADVTLDGHTSGPAISGPGTPKVTVQAVHELTAALAIGHGAGLALVGQTLELRHRLPKLWELVQDLTLPAWQARRAAAETMNLSREAAGFADRHLAVAARTGRLDHRHHPGRGPTGPLPVRARPRRQPSRSRRLASRGRGSTPARTPPRSPTSPPPWTP